MKIKKYKRQSKIKETCNKSNKRKHTSISSQKINNVT